MLILSRRPFESVKIGDGVTVTVLGVKGNQVRLGFTAPAHIAVHREEIYKRMQAESKTLQRESRLTERFSTQTSMTVGGLRAALDRLLLG